MHCHAVYFFAHMRRKAVAWRQLSRRVVGKASQDLDIKSSSLQTAG
ncbi:hypothetical protein V474_06150 [Novosphingobium barchaimii LL02]|uniref:Uncharacterized protein n=1 Tax=Novosphingobium barchaimii LL02 TaxID=1114963 RepID=A0A0J7XFV1_9SPHN|nr:hypothetical protein V474_06150 [Novosphingobium barchaimii LL02]